MNMHNLKENKNDLQRFHNPKSLNTYISIYLFCYHYFFLYNFFGLYKSYPLNRNLVLEICKKREYIKPNVWLQFNFEFFFQMVLSTNVFYFFS
jgi:hypothetical protein